MNVESFAPAAPGISINAVESLDSNDFVFRRGTIVRQPLGQIVLCPAFYPFIPFCVCLQYGVPARLEE